MSAAQRDAVLLSGGMDSIALTHWHRPAVAITVDYGQAPAEAEIQAAAAACEALRIEHVVLRTDCRAVGSGDLAGTPPAAVAPVPEWWPFRNQLLVTLAAAALLPRGIRSLLLGTVRSDGAHADGTAAFVAAASRLLEIQEGAMRVAAPAIELTSAGLIHASAVPLEVLAWAHSCHVANLACGRCRGCNKHREVSREIGVGSY